MTDKELDAIRWRNERFMPGCTQVADPMPRPAWVDPPIVWDREDIRKLLAEIDRLRAENAELRSQIEFMDDAQWSKDK